MSRKQSSLSAGPAGSSTRLGIVRRTSTARRTIHVQHIADALVRAGYTSLDKQAKALGVHRSTTWTIVRRRHKLGYLNAKTIERILTNPELPPCIREVIQRQLAQEAQLSVTSDESDSRENKHAQR